MKKPRVWPHNSGSIKRIFSQRFLENSDASRIVRNRVKQRLERLRWGVIFAVISRWYAVMEPAHESVVKAPLDRHKKAPKTYRSRQCHWTLLIRDAAALLFLSLVISTRALISAIIRSTSGSRAIIFRYRFIIKRHDQSHSSAFSRLEENRALPRSRRIIPTW